MTESTNPCNIITRIDDNDVLTVTIDLKRRLGPSAAKRKDPASGSMLIATTPRDFPLVDSSGVLRQEKVSIQCYVKEPAPLSETQRLLEHAVKLDIEPGVKDVLVLVLECVKGFPKMFRLYLEGKLGGDHAE